MKLKKGMGLKRSATFKKAVPLKTRARNADKVNRSRKV